MGIPKLAILLCCATLTLSSEGHYSHTIPVEGYETELQNLGEHVEIPETPVKVIKITKTIAVKVPVPYPVKVIEKVPYPVHVNKPYPVPVPHIVKVPQPVDPKAIHGQEAIDIGHGSPIYNQINGNSYKVQENAYDNPHHSDEQYEGPSNGEGSYGFNGYPSYGSSDFHEDQGGYSNIGDENHNSFNPVYGHSSYQKF